MSDSTLEANSERPFDCEQQGLGYIAGYIAHTFLKEHPEFGMKTHELGRINHAVDNTPHITAVSRGGLVKPADRFLKKVIRMENIFRSIHNTEPEFIRKIKPMETALQLMQQDSQVNLPYKVIHKFARTRLYIRIKHLNRNKKKKGSLKARDAAKYTHYEF